MVVVVQEERVLRLVLVSNEVLVFAKNISKKKGKPSYQYEQHLDLNECVLQNGQPLVPPVDISDLDQEIGELGQKIEDTEQKNGPDMNSRKALLKSLEQKTQQKNVYKHNLPLEILSTTKKNQR